MSLSQGRRTRARGLDRPGSLLPGSGGRPGGGLGSECRDEDAPAAREGGLVGRGSRVERFVLGAALRSRFGEVDAVPAHASRQLRERRAEPCPRREAGSAGGLGGSGSGGLGRSGRLAGRGGGARGRADRSRGDRCRRSSRRASRGSRGVWRGGTRGASARGERHAGKGDAPEGRPGRGTHPCRQTARDHAAAISCAS